MKFDTFLFGSVDVNPDQILEFPKGLVSFENNKRFMLIHETGPGEYPVSFTLQSLDDKNLAFQIIDPEALGFTYELELSDEESQLLKFEKAEEIAVLLVLFKQENSGSTAGFGANLRAPLLINTNSRRGLQKLLPKLRPNMTLSSLSSHT
ncbi:MAG: flagellar assembly protein FliW [Zoogloeaceae bacterium]|jgi:flagellar assembly factor FliW|nr:flagellar assembly protein FliW [Zoogloeaceae bacterium]